MTLEATPTLVNPTGVSTVDFKDEVETANAQAAVLKKQGVKAIVVLMHEGGYNAGTYNQCVGISDPIATMATQFSPEIDQIITGHTHDPYICSIPDPAGNPRLVTSSASYGQTVTETSLVINTAQRRGRPRPLHRHEPPRPQVAAGRPGADRDHRQVERPGRPAQGHGRRHPRRADHR